MRARATSPVYAQIAFDIAKRIAESELKENARIYGRSLLASEYGVSPETIRRSLRLLADMGIVEIRQNSGGVILSREKAKQYTLRFNGHMDVRAPEKAPGAGSGAGKDKQGNTGYRGFYRIYKREIPQAQPVPGI